MNPREGRRNKWLNNLKEWVKQAREQEWCSPKRLFCNQVLNVNMMVLCQLREVRGDIIQLRHSRVWRTGGALFISWPDSSPTGARNRSSFLGKFWSYFPFCYVFKGSWNVGFMWNFLIVKCWELIPILEILLWGQKSSVGWIWPTRCPFTTSAEGGHLEKSGTKWDRTDTSQIIKQERTHWGMMEAY